MLDFIKNLPLGDLEWTEIFYAAFGSFIGIFVPMWLDKLKARREEKDAQKKLLASLRKELDSVQQLIEEYRKPEHRGDIFTFSTFIWESIIAAGLLPDMLADKKIDGQALMEIYADLSLLKELHDDFCTCPNPEDLKNIFENITALRNCICEKICRYEAEHTS